MHTDFISADKFEGVGEAIEKEETGLTGARGAWGGGGESAAAEVVQLQTVCDQFDTLWVLTLLPVRPQ